MSRETPSPDRGDAVSPSPPEARAEHRRSASAPRATRSESGGRRPTHCRSSSRISPCARPRRRRSSTDGRSTSRPPRRARPARGARVRAARGQAAPERALDPPSPDCRPTATGDRGVARAELPHLDELESELLQLAQGLVELGGCGDLTAQHGLGAIGAASGSPRTAANDGLRCPMTLISYHALITANGRHDPGEAGFTPAG